MEIFHLVYRSKAAPRLRASDLEAILKTAQRKNKENDLTGFLVLRNGYFVQLLEGSETDVRSCLSKIAQDTRHSMLTTIAEFSSGERIRPDWTMALVDSPEQGADVETLLENFDLSRRDTLFKTRESVEAIFRIFAKNAKPIHPDRCFPKK